jgi:hypothetical protein
MERTSRHVLWTSRDVDSKTSLRSLSQVVGYVNVFVDGGPRNLDLLSRDTTVLPIWSCRSET